MNLSRRRLLALATSLPLVAALTPTATAYARATRAAAIHARPLPVGRSTDRCARCGSAGHTMLDTSCPAARTLPRMRRR
jgi:hypothetical protein